MKSLHVAAFALNAALYVAAGILFSSVVPVSFGPVRFWPQALVPAVFAVIFGPWVGGLGAALGIFVNDLALNGNPLLSLLAGVTSNFAMFWLIGYISKKKIRWMPSVVGYGVVTALLSVIAYVYTEIAYVGIVLASYAIFVAFALLAKKRIDPLWQSYNIGAVTGLLAGSSIIGLMVPVYFQYFASTATPLTLASGLAYLIWTFATEIPFLLVLGPPIITGIYKAFPNLRRKEDPREQQ
jgi:hypothetical protein